MENIKTLWELLQEVVENDDDKWYSLHEFLLEWKKSDFKRIESKLTTADQKQFYEYMDWFNFVNEQEVEMAICEYVEHVNQRPLCMWEMWDMRDVAEDYIRERNLNFEEICEECWQVHSELNDWNTTKYSEEIILPF